MSASGGERRDRMKRKANHQALSEFKRGVMADGMGIRTRAREDDMTPSTGKTYAGETKDSFLAGDTPDMLALKRSRQPMNCKLIIVNVDYAGEENLWTLRLI